MAEEQEITARLKARLDQWSAYNQHAEATTPQTEPAGKITVPYSDDQEFAHLADTKLQLSSHALVRRVTAVVDAETVEAEIVDPVVEQRDKHIADLQAAVEHERVRNQELAQTVRREQALHYLTLATEGEEPVAKHTVPEPPAPQPPLAPYSPELFMEDRVNHGRSSARVIPLIVAVLLIGGVWALFNFVL